MATLTITEHHAGTIQARTINVTDFDDALELARLVLGYPPTHPVDGPGLYRAARAGGGLEVEIPAPAEGSR